MRRGNNPKRSRGGRPNNRKGPQGNRSIESHSPGGGKTRGNASQLFERYSNMARDAQSAGDRVAYEGFQQYAEHYLRVLNAAQETRNNGSGRPQGNGQDARPDAGQPALQNAENTDSADAAGNSGNGGSGAGNSGNGGTTADSGNSGNAGGNGSGNGGDADRPPEPTLGGAGGPVPEMLEGPAEVSGDSDQPLDDDPVETETAVN